MFVLDLPLGARKPDHIFHEILNRTRLHGITGDGARVYGPRDREFRELLLDQERFHHLLLRVWPQIFSRCNNNRRLCLLKLAK